MPSLLHRPSLTPAIYLCQICQLLAPAPSVTCGQRLLQFMMFLSVLKPDKASSADEIPPKLLCLCPRGIAVSLSQLFNRSFSESCVPQEWKDALVVPVFKSGSKSAATNYRPIALLSLVSKALEKIVAVKLSLHLQPFLSCQQSGFRHKDSTELQLLRLVQEWSSALDSGEYVGVVFFDLKKAFDRVWHKGILCKLCCLSCAKSLTKNRFAATSPTAAPPTRHPPNLHHLC